MSLWIIRAIAFLFGRDVANAYTLLSSLRLVSLLALVACYPVAYSILRSLNRSGREQELSTTRNHEPELKSAIASSFEALIVSLFPPLFFFSGLYYTDTVSVLWVLLALKYYYETQFSKSVFWGMASLIARQTNVFWVGVYPAGLAAIEIVRNGSTNSKHAKGKGAADGMRQRRTLGALYDPTIGEAYLDGQLCYS